MLRLLLGVIERGRLCERNQGCHKGTVLRTFYKGFVGNSPCTSLKVRYTSCICCDENTSTIIFFLAMAGAGPLISIHPNSWSCQHDDFAYFQGVPYGAGGRLMLRILPHPIGGTLNDLRTVANTPIQQGTTILVERPIFRIPNLSAENINAAVARLIPRNLFCFQGLCHRDRGEGVAITAKDRVDVNNHNAASESDPAKRMGVSLFYSRINHSCMHLNSRSRGY